MSYVNQESVLGIGITFVVTSVAAVAVRFSMRMRLKAGFGVDDWLALGAMVFVIGASCICIAGSVTDTIGAHSPDIGPAIFTLISAQQQLLKKFEFAFYAILIPALVLLKLSVLFFYRRIFKISRAFQICFWALATLSVLWGLSFFIGWAAECRHFEDRITDLETLTTKCANSFTMLVCQAVIDVAVDLAILVLPIPFVLKLKMPMAHKLAVLGILLVGSLAIGCGFARMIIVGMILGTPLMSVPEIAGDSTTDFIGLVSLMIFWGMLELGVGMIAVCLPTMRPLFQGVSMEPLLRSIRSFISLTGTSHSSSKSPSSDGEKDSISESSDRIQKRVDYSVTSSFSDEVEATVNGRLDV